MDAHLDTGHVDVAATEAELEKTALKSPSKIIFSRCNVDVHRGTMENRHGGARVGAGRKPKALKYAPIAEQVEQTIVDAIPEIIAKLISMAKEGDVAAARYVVDRILGRVAVLDAAPVQDKSLPYNENDFDRALYQRVRDLSKSYREEAEWTKEVEARYEAWLTQPTSTSGDTLDDLKRAVEEDDRRRKNE